MDFESELSALLDYEETAPVPVDTGRIMARARRRTRVHKAATGIAALVVAGVVASVATGGLPATGVHATQPGVVTPAPASVPPDSSAAPLATGSPSPVVQMAPGSTHLLLDTGFWTTVDSTTLCLGEPKHASPSCQSTGHRPGARGITYMGAPAVAPDHREAFLGEFIGPTLPTRIVVTVGGEQTVATILTIPGAHDWVAFDAVVQQPSGTSQANITAFDSAGHVLAHYPKQ
jgi:hypothetical protein